MKIFRFHWDIPGIKVLKLAGGDAETDQRCHMDIYEVLNIFFPVMVI
jgi:hypothetical protein